MLTQTCVRLYLSGLNVLTHGDERCDGNGLYANNDVCLRLPWVQRGGKAPGIDALGVQGPCKPSHPQIQDLLLGDQTFDSSHEHNLTQLSSEHPLCNVAFEVKVYLEDLGKDGGCQNE
jgi:hypothetical protein